MNKILSKIRLCFNILKGNPTIYKAHLKINGALGLIKDNKGHLISDCIFEFSKDSDVLTFFEATNKNKIKNCTFMVPTGKHNIPVEVSDNPIKTKDK
uniref:Uncharacterized protein n=1 Tax=viral metagenome TaxID=1070528 RepID=A0A6M3JDF2_9ZZZZ